ncbi:MAG: endonuclease/exonuclease/phosphatase family protein [Proteobacteria bacterium]|nr:endonuclease/exonuclease/phosphatase family protein [Pseudomonadota bacterium]MDA0993256.1 endonuclease/exonuclease/phosphatase family protein [Pseudomonadota bacterium]
MRPSATLIAIAALTGCATYNDSAELLTVTGHAGSAVQSVATESGSATSEGQWHDGVGIAKTDPEACSRQLINSNRSQFDELDSQDIRMVNWNIRKGADLKWTSDLETFQTDSDLMIFQEAALNSNSWALIATDQYRSFAPGYRTRRSPTGVMTVSAMKPLTQCNLVSIEPWIRTPKATMITEYGLTGTDQTLLVINMHAVNFTIGTRIFEEQLRQARSVVDEHQGPILLSGDFNTWRWRRWAILQEMTTSLGLETLDYDEDHRKRVFGRPLDHIYVRGLEVLQATTGQVDSSDHNPMLARLRLWTESYQARRIN